MSSGVSQHDWWTLAAVGVSVFMLLVDFTIVNIALPSIGADLHASLAELQWVIDAYALAAAAPLLMAGSLADLYGRRALFAAGLTLFTAASLMCAVASSPVFLIVARTGQGIGAAVVFATSLALVAQAIRGHDRARAFSILGAITAVGLAVGPVLGGLITSALSWRWVFFINLPVGALALAITLGRMTESHYRGAQRPDVLGFVIFSLGLAGLVFALIHGSANGWRSPAAIASFAAAASLLSAFAVVERIRQDPMLDLGLMRVPTFAGTLITAWTLNATVFAVITYIVLFLQQALRLTPAQAGVRLLPLTGAIVVASGVAGRLSDRVPKRLLITAGFVFVGAGLLLMRGLTVNSTWMHLLAGMLVAGFGAGLVGVPLAITAIGIVEPERAGMASGIVTTLRHVGTAMGVAILGAILAGDARTAVTVSGPARRGFAHGMNALLLAASVVAFAAAAASFALVRERDSVLAGPEVDRSVSPA